LSFPTDVSGRSFLISTIFGTSLGASFSFANLKISFSISFLSLSSYYFRIGLINHPVNHLNPVGYVFFEVCKIASKGGCVNTKQRGNIKKGARRNRFTLPLSGIMVVRKQMKCRESKYLLRLLMKAKTKTS